MSTVTPPPPPASAPPPTAPPAPTGIVLSPPPAVSGLDIGAKLDAVITALGTRGTASLETALGKLTLQTAFPLPKDAPLQLQILSASPRLQVLITAINGQSPQAILRNPALAFQFPATGGTGGAPSPATGGLFESAPVRLTMGSIVSATLIGGPSKSGPLTGSLTPQGQVSGGLAGTGAPAASSARPGTAPVTGPMAHTPSGKPPAQSGVPSPFATVSAAQVAGATPPPRVFTVGNQFSIRITGFVPPNQLSTAGGLPTTGPDSVATGQSMTGVVIGRSALGQSVVQTHAGPIAVSTPTPVPTGTTITFQVEAPLPDSAPEVARAVASKAGQVILGTRSWPEAEEALKTLSDTHPAAAQHLINALIPRPGTSLGSQILFFIAALRGGDIRGWIGDAPIRALQRLRPELATKLRDNFGTIAKLSDDSSSAEWRAYPVPLLNGAEIDLIRFFVRRIPEDEENDETDEEHGTRFVVDVELSRLGRLQLDGLIHDKHKRFDLIVRTDERLPANVQNGIREIFSQTSEWTGTEGGVTFQAAPPDFVELVPAIDADGDLGLFV